MDFFSHPGKLLKTHLQEVNDFSRYRIDSILKESGKIDESIIKACEVQAFSHDFGKYTTYFQNHLLHGIESRYSRHSFISALFGAYVAQKIVPQGNMPLFIYSSIIHHHGNESEYSKYLPRGRKYDKDKDLIGDMDILDCQKQDLKKNIQSISSEYGSYGEYVKEFLEKTEYDDLFLYLKKLNYNLSKEDEKNYFQQQLLYSLLIYADKLSAAGLRPVQTEIINFTELNDNLKSNILKNDTQINIIRAEIYSKVLSSIEGKTNEKIFSITAPTGTGKTYTGFMSAVKLREELSGTRKIIYVLPFTSIIDQNYFVIEKLFQYDKKYNAQSSEYLIKHHHLTDFNYNDSEEKYDSSKSELLIETWESGVVVTTFVQLLETLISNKNSMLKKFNKLCGSIILLDEVQAIPVDLYGVCEYVLEKASQELDCRIIMMTATKPMIFGESVELLENNKEYFKKFNRTVLNIETDKKITVPEFAEVFECRYSDKKSYLTVCNTIKQSLEVYELLKIKYGEKVKYLSTNLLPIHRKTVIDTVRQKLKDKEKIILVSTQVVEAGIDLDFDEVYRDIGPLDSIVQCAGRCNRSGLDQKNNVYVVRMKDENDRGYAEKVYGRHLIEVTMEVLKNKTKIEEVEYYDTIEEYFSVLKEKRSQNISNNFIKAIKQVDFSFGENKESISKFTIINERPDLIDVFVVYDEKAQALLDKYKKLIGIKDYFQRHNEFLKIKKDLNEYILTIPLKYVSILQNSDKVLNNIPYEAVSTYYEASTGFKQNKDVNAFIW